MRHAGPRKKLVGGALAVSKLKQHQYEDLLGALQQELEQMQRWVEHSGERIVILFEGRDAAGKGGAIHAISERLNPRHCRIVALGKPTECEAGQWYFQRHVAHLPTAGEIVLFDRSWYNRAGVEKVMGFAKKKQVNAFLDAVPSFEKLLTGDGIRLFKYWLTCDQAEQEERFAERLADPLKRWKLSPIDLEARGQYAAYTKAREAMLKATHTDHAPWTLVDFNDQRRGRLTLIRDLLDRLPDFDVKEPPLELAPLAEPPRKEKCGRIKPLKPFEP
ncbi:polyphosphate kinase 2 [Novosphingobium flavum]|uniref:ADP/GDP-polyphosphate phosphotransferase n=1 Tax=Novosphingobium flavum TaxID=1778672 RepID=A0A7X1KKM1_9SPHN|nr:polyphosphate kinase 2 [Novosphingobium flavum]